MSFSRRAFYILKKRNRKIKLWTIICSLIFSVCTFLFSLKIYSYFDWGYIGNSLKNGIQVIYLITVVLFIPVSIIGTILPIAHLFKSFFKIFFNVWLISFFFIYFSEISEIEKTASLISFAVVYVYLEVLLETHEKLLIFFSHRDRSDTVKSLAIWLSTTLSILLVATIHLVMPLFITWISNMG